MGDPLAGAILRAAPKLVRRLELRAAIMGCGLFSRDCAVYFTSVCAVELPAVVRTKLASLAWPPGMLD